VASSGDAQLAVDRQLLDPLAPGGQWSILMTAKLTSVWSAFYCQDESHGIPLLFHQQFEEVNLRFYVRRSAAGNATRVVFIKEIVPAFSSAVPHAVL